MTNNQFSGVYAVPRLNHSTIRAVRSLRLSGVYEAPRFAPKVEQDVTPPSPAPAPKPERKPRVMVHYAKGFMFVNGKFFEAVITCKRLRLLRVITPDEAAAVDNSEFSRELQKARKLYGPSKAR